MECLNLFKGPNLLGKVRPDNFVHLSLLPLSNLHANPTSSVAASLLGTLSDCPPFLFPRAARCGSLSSTKGWNISLNHSTCPSSPTPTTSRATHNICLCSKADFQGWVFSSPRLPPLPYSVSLPPPHELGLGKGLGSAGSRLWYLTQFHVVCSVLQLYAVWCIFLSCCSFRIICINCIFVVYVVLGGGLCLTSHTTIFNPSPQIFIIVIFSCWIDLFIM